MTGLQGAGFDAMTDCSSLSQAFHSILDTHRLRNVQGNIQERVDPIPTGVLWHGNNRGTERQYDRPDFGNI